MKTSGRRGTSGWDAREKRQRRLVKGACILIVAAAVAAGIGIVRRIEVQEGPVSETQEMQDTITFSHTTEAETETAAAETGAEETAAAETGAAETTPAETAPETQPETPDDFSDAVFIGDSRTDGLMIYTGLYTSTFYTANGQMVDTAQTEKNIRLENGEKGTVLDALRQHTFRRVYVMLGINELGWYFEEEFKGEYRNLIEQIRQIQPQATIYIQSVLPVTKEKSESDAIYNNENVRRVDAWVQEVAEETGATYLNVKEVMTDSEGNLPADGASDGVHLTKTYCEIWLEYLRTHN